jgi:hypothetical protein
MTVLVTIRSPEPAIFLRMLTAHTTASVCACTYPPPLADAQAEIAETVSISDAHAVAEVVRFQPESDPLHPAKTKLPFEVTESESGITMDVSHYILRRQSL